MEVGSPEADAVRVNLSKTRVQLQQETVRREAMGLEMKNLRNRLKTLEGEDQDFGRLRELARKTKLLEEQVQYLEGRLDTCRQEGALKLASIEGLLVSENGKLRAREKDLRKKLQRERETNRQQTARVRDLAVELRRTQEESKRFEVHQTGWMKRVRLPQKGEWPTIKLDTRQNQKALRHIFEQVAREGGPPVNLDPSLFLHCVILFLWWKREATVRMLEENNGATSGNSERKVEMEELRGLNTALQQRVRALEDALGDCRMERRTFETTVSTNLNQLLKDKYDLGNKVARLEDTVSALHLDNNLLRAEVNDKSASQQAKMDLDELTAELKSRLQTSESELRETRLLKEQMEMDQRQESKRLQTLAQDARIQEAVCREHTERVASGVARRAELEAMTSELQAKTRSLQHDLQNLEESRNTLAKERDSFLGQLTKALDQLEDSREKIRGQDYQIRQISNDQAHKTQALQRNDEVVDRLRRQLANHREAQAKLVEEKEKRRSLEVISTNRERLVKEMEERMRSEEVDSATLLAELCGAQTEERERLEAKIETLKMEREEMAELIETLTTDKAVLRADAQRLRMELDGASEKVRAGSRAAAEPVTAATATHDDSPTVGRDGRDERDDPGGERVRRLEELVDLLVTVKGSAFSRLMLGGMDGGASEEFQDDPVEDCESSGDDEDTRMHAVENGSTEDEDSDDLRRPADIGEAQRDIVTKLRALALVMKARQKLSGRGSREVKGHADINQKSHQDSHPDYPELVNEPLFTKEERPLLYSPNKPYVRDGATADRRPTTVPSPDAAVTPKTTADQQQTESPKEIDSGRGAEERTSDETLPEPESEDLLSTLERERRRLTEELADIRDAEARAQEHLEQEEEAHLLYMRTVRQYEEECSRMQQEKEDLLREPSVDENLAEEASVVDGRRPTLDLELERLLLEELESLKAENEVLVSERFRRGLAFENRGEGRQSTPLPLSGTGGTLSRTAADSGDCAVGLDDQADSETTSAKPGTDSQVSESRPGADAPQPNEHPETAHPVVARYQGPRPEDHMPDQQNRSLSKQPGVEDFMDPKQRDKTVNELNTALRKTRAQQAEGGNPQDLLADQFIAEDKAVGHREPRGNSPTLSLSLSSVSNPFSPLSEFEKPVRKTLVSRQEAPLRHALAALEQTYGTVGGQRSGGEEVNRLITDNGRVVSPSGESGDEPEADQLQEHHPSRSSLSRQDAVMEQILQPEGHTPKSHQSKESDPNGRELRSKHLPTSRSPDPKARRRRPLQKQRTVGESNQPSSLPESDCDGFPPGVHGNARASRRVPGLNELQVLSSSSSSKMIPDDACHTEQSGSTSSPNDRGGVENCKETEACDFGVTRDSGEFETSRNREMTGVSALVATGSQSIDTPSSQQDNKQTVNPEPTPSSSVVSGDSNTKGVNRRKQILRSRRIRDTQREETVVISDQDRHHLDPLSKRQGIHDLPEDTQESKTSSRDNQSYTRELERELSESQASLLELHRDRQRSQDQLTAALQAEVKLQRLVDGLRAKVDRLQASTDKSAQLIGSLEADKYILKSNHTAAREERRRIQRDLTRVNKINSELQERLQPCSKQCEILRKKHDALKKRYACETDKKVELQRQVVELQEAAAESKSPAATVDRVGERGSPASYKEVRRTNQDQVEGKLQRGSAGESGENTELRCLLTEDEQSVPSQRWEVDRLHRQAGTVQSPTPDVTELLTIAQQKSGFGLAAAGVKEENNQKNLHSLETRLVAAQREIKDLSKKSSLLEIENETLQTRWMAEAEKRLELQTEVSKLKRGSLRLRNKPSMETKEYTGEGRPCSLSDNHLKKQLEDQMDRVVDLESQLDDSQAVVKDSERERDILQDDFTTALQKNSLLKTQTKKAEDRCQVLTRKLEDSRAQVQSLTDEMEGYLEQDSQKRDEEVRLLRKKLRESRVDCRRLNGELEEAKLRVENLEAISKMHSDERKRDATHTVKLESDLHELKVANQEMTRQLLQLGRRAGNFDGEAERLGALPLADKNGSGRGFANRTTAQERSEMRSDASKPTLSVASRQVVEANNGTGFIPGGANEGKLYDSAPGREELEHGPDGLGYQIRDIKEAVAANFKGLESAHAGIVDCSQRLLVLEQRCGTSVGDLQEELGTQTSHITRLRESTEARLQDAVSMTKRLTQDCQQAIASMVEKDLSLRLKDAQVTSGQRLLEMRKLLERSITEQRRQAASVAKLQQTQERALLQHSALKIRLGQQAEKASGALSGWARERQSLKRQLGEAYKCLKLIEKQVGSSVSQSLGLPGLGAGLDRLMSQQDGHTRGMVGLIQNCPCRREYVQHERFSVSTQTTKEKQTEKDDVMELKRTNRQISFDLQLASESLELKKKECWRLQECVQDACLTETELASTIRQLQDQVKLEVEMQAKLAKRSEDQEAELFRLRSALRRQSFNEGSSTNLIQEPSTKPNKLNEMLTDFSREIQGHLESHMEKTQLQNETDDRKKIQDLERQLSNMDTQLSVDKITVQSLTDDNRRLRAMVYKLRERIASNQMSHFKDSRMDGVYQALARAQVRVVATSMADGTQTVLAGAGVFGHAAATGLSASRLADRRHVSSAGNSLGDSYD